MKLAAIGAPGREAPGLVRGGEALSLATFADGARDVGGLIAAWPAIEGRLTAHGLDGLARVRLEDARLAAPLLRPGKIIGVGSNFRSADGAAPDLPPAPIFFLKPSSSLIGPGDAIVAPREARSVVGEVEIAVIIGKAGRRVGPAAAMDHVFGYTIANDVTAPEILLGESARNPLFLQAARGKGFPSFCPLGPWIVTKDEIDPADMHLQQLVNGEIEAEASARLMIHSVAELVSEASDAFGLEAGDVILCGSPRPTGRRRALQAGDILTSRISGIGELVNPIRSEAAGDPDARQPGAGGY
ncbi:MAG: fumarylacetoacetate hydrolase family protein [Hyphomonadaceae bacterium]|nr:fumarylacetoacetate hydrolase family protein [Hyphomonadaceae bacterium]